MYVMMPKIFEKVQKEFGRRMYDFTLVPLSLPYHFPSLHLEVGPQTDRRTDRRYRKYRLCPSLIGFQILLITTMSACALPNWKY